MRWDKIVGAFWIMWILVVTIMDSAQASGSELILQPNQNEYRIGMSADFFTDVAGNMTLQHIKKQQFHPIHQEIINLGFNTQTHWIRLIINNKKHHRDQEWVINTYSSHVGFIDLYCPDTVYHTGSQLHFNTRPLTHREIAFPIHINSGAVDTYFVKVKSYRSNVYRLELQTLQAWNDYVKTDWILLSGFFCSVLVMFLYNLLLYISIRDHTYVAYLIYQVGLVLLFFYLKGLAIQYLWHQNDSIHIITTHIGPVMAGLALSWFSSLFLKLRDYSTIGWRILYGFQFLWISVFVFSVINWLLFPPQAQVYVDMLENMVAGSQSLMCIIWGIYVWHKGYKPAKYYVVGFSMLLIGIFAFVMKNLGFLKNFAWSNYIFQYGVLVELAFLSLALADKINVMKDEKEKMAKENERILREQNQLLEVKVAERTYELNEVNNELVHLNEVIIQTLDYVSQQSEIIQDKNQDITESIQYAWRIQNAILPEIEIIRKYIPDLFVFYRPKDIVSGDFYWFAHNEAENISFLATVDCTGHGVPGAFMSVIGCNVLNRVVIENGITDTALILTALDKGVRSALKQDQNSDKKTHDGMDLSLCAIHHRTNQIFFTGAQASIYRLRAGEIEIIKGDKFPVGGAQAEVKIFTATEVHIQAGDRIYLFTDGIVDQFGGAQKRKFTPKRLQQLILDLQNLPMIRQLDPLAHNLDEWKGNHKQLDDMSLIGFQLL